MWRRYLTGAVDMVLCDLPYGTTQNKWDSVIPFEPRGESTTDRERTAIVLTVSQPFTTDLINSNRAEFVTSGYGIRQGGNFYWPRSSR